MHGAVFIDLAALPVLDDAARAFILMNVSPESSIDIKLPIRT